MAGKSAIPWTLGRVQSAGLGLNAAITWAATALLHQLLCAQGPR